MEHLKIHYPGIHCDLVIEQFPGRVVTMRISGSDVGEFGGAPMAVLDEWLAAGGPVDFFVDAREVRGASIEVSGEWARWMGANKAVLHSITMLTGSRFIQITAEFVRRFAELEGKMRVCTDPAAFDKALAEAAHTVR